MLIFLYRGGRYLNTSLLGIDSRPRVFGLVCYRIVLLLPCGPPFSVQFLTTLVSTWGSADHTFEKPFVGSKNCVSFMKGEVVRVG